MAPQNPRWDRRRIHGELLVLRQAHAPPQDHGWLVIPRPGLLITQANLDDRLA